MAKLLELTEKPKNEQDVAQMTPALVPHLQKCTNSYPEALFRLAVYAKNPQTARLLLAQGSIKQIQTETAGFLVELQTLYGVSWCLNLLHAWKEKDSLSYHNPITSIDKLPFHKLIEMQADKQLSIFFLQYYSELFLKQNEWLRLSTPSTVNASLTLRLQHFTQLLHACSALGDTATAYALLQSTLAAPTAYPLEELGDLVKNKLIVHMDAVQTLKSKVVGAISEELARGLQMPGDWTVYKQLPSHCADCSVVNQFLSDASMAQKIWPMAAERRKHVQQFLEDYLIPVDCEVRKQGSPHQLILTKNPQLYAIAQKRFNQLQKLAKDLKIA